MTTTYQITKILGRDGIRTRQDGEIAYANLDMGDYTLTIQTQVRDAARPVFRVSDMTLVAENDAAVAYHDTQRAAYLDRRAREQASTLAAHEAAEAAFGPITVGSPKQIAYAEQVRAETAPSVQRILARIDRWQDVTLEQAQEVRDVVAQLQHVAAFWLDCRDFGTEVGRYLDARDRATTRIGRLLADV